MKQSGSLFFDRFRTSVQRWLQNRWQECIQCNECQAPIAPFAALCPVCGQAKPAKVSTYAGVYLAIGCVALAGIVSLAIKVF